MLSEWDDFLVGALLKDTGRLGGGAPAGRVSTKGKPSTASFTQMVEGFGDWSERREEGWVPVSLSWRIGSWSRPGLLRPEAPWTLEPEPIYLTDLLTANPHLASNKIIKKILASLVSLEAVGSLREFPIEWDSGKFYPNTEGYWKPWHHLYSHGPVGKGTTHSLRYNDSGFYVVRIFLLGSWRAMPVDDLLPYDGDGQCLLPLCSNNPFNLWLPLLTKALLKAASLYWTFEKEETEFDYIGCLTGWTRYRIDCSELTSEEMWKLLKSQLIKNLEPQEPCDVECCAVSDSIECINDHLPPNQNSPLIYTFLTVLQDQLNSTGDSPLSEERIFFLDRVSERIEYPEPLPQWKRGRWKDWAVKKGLIEDPVVKVFRKVELYDTMKPPVKRQSGVVKLGESRASSFDKIKRMGRSNTHLKIDLSRTATRESIFFENPFPINTEDYDNLPKVYRWFDIYYSPRYFKFSKGMNNLPADLFPPVTSKKSQGVEVNAPPDQSFHDCFYIFCDSPFCKSLLLSIQTFPPSLEAQVTVEAFDWATPNIGPILLSISSTNSDSKILQLGPGMQTCRIWYYFPNLHYIQLCSNTQLTVGNKEAIQNCCASVSSSYTLFAEGISRNFQLLSSTEPETPERAQMFFNFMTSFCPPQLKRLPNDSTEKLDFIRKLEKIFEASYLELLTEAIPEADVEQLCNVIHKLQDLFSNPLFGEAVLEARAHEMDQVQLQTNETPSIKEVAGPVKKIISVKQDAKKDKSDKSAVNANHPNADFLLDSTGNCTLLLRKMLGKEEGLSNYYPFKNDDNKNLTFFEYKGTYEVSEDLILICRLILNVHSSSLTPCSFQMFSNLKYHKICIYDIVTQEQKFSYLNESLTFELGRSLEGYAVCVFGKMSDGGSSGLRTEREWRLRVVGRDWEDTLHPCHSSCSLPSIKPNLTPSPLDVQLLKGFYVPNEDDIIVRFLVIVKSKTVVTLRATVTNPKVELEMILSDAGGVAAKSSGLGRTLIPVLLIEPDKASPEGKTDTLFYKGELKVLYKSWPLTEEEITLLEELNKTSQGSIKRKKSLYDASGSHTAETVSTGNSVSPSRPHWTIEMFREDSESAILMRDTRRADKFFGSVYEKESSQPGRGALGQTKRLQFIASLFQGESGNKEDSKGGEEEEVEVGSRARSNIWGGGRKRALSRMTSGPRKKGSQEARSKKQETVGKSRGEPQLEGDGDWELDSRPVPKVFDDMLETYSAWGISAHVEEPSMVWSSDEAWESDLEALEERQRVLLDEVYAALEMLNRAPLGEDSNNSLAGGDGAGAIEVAGGKVGRPGQPMEEAAPNRGRHKDTPNKMNK